MEADGEVAQPLVELLALAAALPFAFATDAAAHARLTRAVPSDGSSLATPPAKIDLWFNELLDDDFNDVAVHRANADGGPADDENFATGKPQVDPSDRTHLVTDLRPLAPGDYVVQWKVLSRDGHSARGRVRFSVGKQD